LSKGACVGGLVKFYALFMMRYRVISRSRIFSSVASLHRAYLMTVFLILL